jgi:hypothetical protein
MTLAYGEVLKDPMIRQIAERLQATRHRSLWPGPCNRVTR